MFILPLCKVQNRLMSDTTPHSLKDSNTSPKVEIVEEKRVGIRSLTHSTSGVEGSVGARGWELR